MNRLILISLSIVFLAGCKKDKNTNPGDPVGAPHPVMAYTDLQNAEVKFGGLKDIDIDHNGTVDFSFSTLLVGDPVLQRDRRQYIAKSKVDANLLHGAGDETPAFNNRDTIALQHPGLAWFRIASIVLAEKIIPLVGNNSWQGSWKQANHKYLAVQVNRNGNFYHGWIEMSFDILTEKMILHKAAICTQPNVTVKAGL